jgi:hypothetical protein
MPPVGFESTISVLERTKTVRALGRAATAIGLGNGCVIWTPHIVRRQVAISKRTKYVFRRGDMAPQKPCSMHRAVAMLTAFFWIQKLFIWPTDCIVTFHVDL